MTHDQATPIQPIYLLNAGEPVCRQCGRALERKPRHRYNPPFIAPADWCERCELHKWEQPA